MSGQDLKNLRAKLGITQNELAIKLELKAGATHISRLERTETLPDGIVWRLRALGMIENKNPH